nr:hypothetical protein [Tanacetum cinerariifolium]
MSQPRKFLTRDQLVPVFKQYDMASANKNMNLINPSCPPASKILGEILRRHPICYALITYASIPWIYMQQMWHTLKLVDSKDKFKFMVDEEEVIVENDKVVKSIFNSRKTKRQGMRIPDSLLTEEIKQTNAFKCSKETFIIRIPNRKQPNPETLIRTATQTELQSLIEAKQVNYTLAKSAKEYEAQQNVKSVEDHLLDEDVNRLVKGEEYDTDKFADEMMLTTNVPSCVDAFLKNYMNNILHVHPTTFVSSLIPDLQQQLYLKMKDDEQAHNANFILWLTLMYKFEKPVSHVDPCIVDAFHRQDHDDHHDDDARYETTEESYHPKSPTQEQQQEFDSWSEDQGTDDDEVPSEEVLPELLVELSGNN